MYNKVILMGRITKELELKTTPSGVSVLSFSVAVDRRFVDKGGERQTDFFNCVAWRQQAEFITRYFGKGSLIHLEGELQNRTYNDKNGKAVWVTEIIVDRADFTGEKKNGGVVNEQASAQTDKTNEQASNTSSEDDGGYPF